METVMMDAEFDVCMDGTERYPIIGSTVEHRNTILLLFGEDYIKKLYQAQSMLKGLPLYANCLEKAMLARKLLGGTLVAGAMRVLSEDMKSAYGFDFRLPYECHVWLEYIGGCIVDLALPGVILRGMKSKDEQGPFIVGREPSILAGYPPEWLIYKPVRIVEC